MPKPRRMQTLANSDRAIVRPGMVVLPCSCGCGGLDQACVIERSPDPTAIPEYTEAQRLTLAPDIKSKTVREAVNQGLITEEIIRTADERRRIMAGLDKELKELVKMAEDQGFTVVEDGTSIKWTNAEGGTVSTPNRVIGRGLQNVRAQLRRLGLEIPRTGKGQVRETEPTTDVPATDGAAPAPVISDEVSQAYAALATLTEFVAGHQHDDEADEWSSICEGLETELATARAERDQAIAERDELRSKLDTVRSLFQA